MNKAKFYPWIFAVAFGVVGVKLSLFPIAWVYRGCFSARAALVPDWCLLMMLACFSLGAVVGYKLFGQSGFVVGMVIGMFMIPVIFLGPTLGLGYLGYVLGEEISERSEKKRRDEFERERRITGEERKRLEYEQKIKEYKAKVEQWEREGYDVSKLRERWFK